MTDESETPTTESTETEAATERPLSLLASEMFKDDYHGSVPDPDSEPEPTAEPEAPEESEPPEEGESEEESEVAESEGEDEGEPISSLEELIEHQEWDPEWARSLRVPVKIDGEPAEVAINDLVANYQMDQAADKRLEDAKSKAKSIQEEAAQKSEAVEENFAQSAKLIEHAEKLIDDESSKINWQQLREDDPAEYSAKKSELAERKDAVEKMKNEAVEEYRKYSTQNQQQSREQLQAHLQQEHQALIEAIPEWSDEKKAAEDKAKVAKYLEGLGYSENEVMGASDHKAIVLARKAMLYDEGAKRTDAAKKKVAKVPKVMKPGTPKPQDQANREKVDKQRAKLKKTGKLEDAYSLLKSRRIGG